MVLRSAKNNPIPSAEQFNRAMQVAALTISGAEYFSQQVAEHFRKFPDLLKVCDELQQKTKYFYQSEVNSWDGQLRSSDKQNFHANLAAESVAGLEKANLSQIRFDFSVKDDAQLVRAYVSEEGGLAPEMIEKLDNLFNDWLIQKGLVSEEGYFYSEKALGEREPLRPEEVIAMMREGSFEKYMQAHKINLVSQYHEFVSPESRVAREQAIQEVQAQVEQAKVQFETRMNV